MESKYNIKFYKSIKKLLTMPMKLLFNTKVTGLENIPNKPYIISGNHRNMFDVVILITNIDDEIHFMAKKELFKLKILNNIFRNMGAFPVDREKINIKAIKESLRLLKSGEVLGIFPEGTRNKTDNILLPFKEGVISIAGKTNVPIVPFGIGGKFKRNNLTLNIGKPIYINDLEKEKQKEYLEDKVKELVLGKF